MIFLTLMEFMALDNTIWETTWCLAGSGKLEKLFLSGEKKNKNQTKLLGWPREGILHDKKTFEEFTPFI